MDKPPPIVRLGGLLLIAAIPIAFFRQPLAAQMMASTGLIVLAIAEAAVWIVKEIRRGG